MKKGFLVLAVMVFLVSCITTSGCRSKERSMEDEYIALEEGAVAPITEEGMVQDTFGVTEVETIPPTASPEVLARPASAVTGMLTKEKEIQTALRNAGFYGGSIDGKIGPKTKKAIEDFQKANGLVVDGKVGPKTWGELEKYLAKK